MKRKSIIKSLVWLFIIICVCFLGYKSCQIVGYLKGVKMDVIYKLKMSKDFFVKYNFSGRIIKREFHNKENYYIYIKLDSLVKMPSFPYDCYYDEYNFDTKGKILKIKVSKKIYDNSDIDAIAIKPSTSYYIFIDDKCYLLLGKGETEWNPPH